MPRQPAKVLGPDAVRLLLRHVHRRRHAHRDRVIILLSFKAGLRACEISGLDWTMVLNTNGRLADSLQIARSIAKKGFGRQIPLHKDLGAALTELHRQMGRPRDGPVARSERGGRLTPRSIVNWFHTLYAELGLIGCSSHSGRRTFITQSARILAKTGGSLRDIQELAGHRAITTTERYIQGDRAAQRKLISLL